MKYCFDIDGTLCSTNCHYKNAEPFIEVIYKVNALYKNNEIILFTSRGYKSGIDWREFTESQLKGWNVNYHQLILGKPQADLYIDDRCINIDDWCKQNGLRK